MSLFVACGKRRNMGADEGRKRIKNEHSEYIWGGRMHSTSEYGFWSQTV